MKETVNIGHLFVTPGSKGTGFLEISNRADGSTVGLPVIVINGSGEGPTLCLDSGNHGDEYEGTEAIITVAKKIDPSELNGTLICVPVLNFVAFEAGVRVNPFEYYKIDMNRSYPGNEDGWLTEQIAFKYFHDIASRADYAISFHGGGTYLSPCAYTVCQSSEFGSISEKSKELARFFGMRLISFPRFGGSFEREAAKRGIPAIIAEIGGHSDRYRHRQHYVELGEKGILNVMRYLGMLKGKAVAPEEQILVQSVIVRSKRAGLWRPEIQAGEDVSKGDILGKVFDFFGEEIECVRSPVDGIVTIRWDFPFIQAAGYAYFVGERL